MPTGFREYAGYPLIRNGTVFGGQASVSWEWKGKTAIRDLKPICPKCAYELDIKMSGFKMEYGQPTEDGCVPLKITKAHVRYICSKCDYSMHTTIDGIDEPKDLCKVAQKEFEHRQRIMLRRTSKNNK